MTRKHRKTAAVESAEKQLKRAEDKAKVVAAQGNRVERRLGLIARLADGWDRVHEENHLGQLFLEEWGKTR